MKREQKTQAVAIAADDMRLLAVLGDYLAEAGGFSPCRAYRRGAALLDDLARGRTAEILLLDEQLQDMDAEQFLQRLRQQKNGAQPSVILMASHTALPRLAGAELDTAAMAVKPLQLDLLVQRMRACAGMAGEKARSRCAALARQLGIAEDTVNGGYLCEAMTTVLASSERLALRKKVLRGVSEQHKVSVSAVDSGLRRVLESMEQAPAAGYLLFKQEYGLGAPRPTVGCFLHAVYRYGELCRQREGGR